MTYSIDLYLARRQAHSRYREFIGYAVLTDHRDWRSRTRRDILKSAARMFRGCMAHQRLLEAVRGQAVMA